MEVEKVRRVVIDLGKVCTAADCSLELQDEHKAISEKDAVQSQPSATEVVFQDHGTDALQPRVGQCVSQRVHALLECRLQQTDALTPLNLLGRLKMQLLLRAGCHQGAHDFVRS
jgi:hypothetical protein